VTPWSSREELQDAANAYGRDWWRADEAAQKVIADTAAHPGLAEQMLATCENQIVPTTDIYQTHPAGDGQLTYLPKRQAIHEDIVRRCVPDPTLSPTSQAGSTTPGRTPRRPVAYFTTGGPGAGKSTFLRRLVQRQRERAAAPGQSGPCSLIDADKVRQALPEYADGLGSVVVETECYYLTYGPLFDAAVAAGHEIVYDTIGRFDSIRDYLNMLIRAGYEVHMIHAAAPASACQERADRRATDQDGRLVPDAIVNSGINESADTLRTLVSQGLLAGWATYDTTGLDHPRFVEGTPPWSDLDL